MNEIDIYRSCDPRRIPLYSLGDTARILGIPSPTLRSWIAGWTVPCDTAPPPPPLLHRPDPTRHALSFENVVEAHVLRALWTEHGVDARTVSLALAQAERAFGIERLLLRYEPLLAGSDSFLARYSALANLSSADRLALRSRLIAHLRRVEHDDAGAPARLYPFFYPSGARGVVIDPRRSSGRPVLVDSGISTHVIAGRFRAGECVAHLAYDYEVEEEEIQTALTFHRLAA